MAAKVGGTPRTASVPGVNGAADPTDPYIVAQAKKLNNDVNQIFAFVRDQIGFDGYYGSLRGARGALWSRSANSLDKASLLSALLQASGITNVRYAQGQLSQPQTLQLLSQIFPAQPTRMYGSCLGSNQASINPQTGNVYSEVASHFWLQYNAGAGFVDADPSFAGNPLGTAVTTATTTFTTIPANLNHTVTVRLDAEFFSPGAASLSGTSGLSATNVFNQTYNSAELAGHPMSVGHFVKTTGVGAIFSVQTNTYSPYILFGQNSPNVDSDPIVRGTDYQEVLTNFTFGSQILSGLVLHMDVNDPNAVVQTYDRTIFDRIGFAARAGAVPVNLQLPAGATAFTDFDVYTFNVISGFQSLDPMTAQQTRMTNAQNAYSALQPQVAALPAGGPFTPAQQALLKSFSNATRNAIIAINETTAMGFAASSDRAVAQLQTTYLGRAYYVSPRLVLALSQKNGDSAQIKLDIRKNDIRFLPQLYNPDSAAVSFWFEVARGMMESVIEGKVLTRVTGQTATAIDAILGQLTSPDDITLITPFNVTDLDSLNISANAKALIQQTVANNSVVLTPTRMVTINGTQTIGWLETDQTGHTISTFEDGGHQALVQYGNALQFSQEFNKPIAKFIGFIAGFGLAGQAYTAAVLSAAANASSLDSVAKDTKTTVSQMIKKAKAGLKIFEKLKKFVDKLQKGAGGPFSLIANMGAGLQKGLDIFDKILDFVTPNDPPVTENPVGNLLPPIPPVTPGASAGVNLTVVSDPFFTITAGNAEYPTAYIARITNTGPQTDSFRMLPQGAPQGFNVSQTIGGYTTVSLAPGASFEQSVCVIPNGVPPAPGSTSSLTLQAFSATNNAIFKNVTIPITVPAVQGALLGLSSSDLTGQPGSSATAVLSITNTGNTSTTVTLTPTLPSGVGISGLNSPVTVAAGRVVTQNLTFPIASTVAVNQPLLISIDGTFNNSAGISTVSANITAGSGNSGCAVPASTSATNIGLGALGNSLSSLATQINALSANAADTVSQARAVATLNVIATQLTQSFASTFAPQFTSAAQGLATATAAQIPGQLSSLATMLCNLSTTLNAAQTYNFNVVLNPNSAQNLPNTPVVFPILIQNTAPIRRTFNLLVSGLPNNVTSAFNVNSITLLPNETSSTYGGQPLNLTLTTPTGNLTAYTFTVTATDAAIPSNVRSATGSLTTRNEIITLDNISPSPGILATAGTPFTVSARLFNAVNQSRNVNIFYRLLRGSTVVYDYFYGSSATLTTSSSLQTITSGPIQTTNLPLGAYQIEVSAWDPSASAPITGATARGSLFIGSPLNATLSANPTTVPPSGATTQVTLALNRDSATNKVSNLVGSIQTPGTPSSVALFGNYAYVCARTNIRIVDISNPASPTIVNNAFADALLANDYNTGCSILTNIGGKNYLSLVYAKQNATTDLALILYDITNPLNPVQVSQSTVSRRIAGYPLIQFGSNAFTITDVFIYNPYSNFIQDMWGNFLSFNVANPASPSLQGELYPSPPFDAVNGGKTFLFGIWPASNTIFYAATTDAVGSFDPLAGGGPYGQILVVSVSNPGSPQLVGSPVKVKTTEVINGIAVQNNQAVAVGDTRGYYDINGQAGNVVFAGLDTTNPAAPVLKSSSVTSLYDKSPPTIVSIGNNWYAAGNATAASGASGQAYIVLVDGTDPANLRYIPYNVASESKVQAYNNGYVYATSSLGLQIYQITTVTGPRLTAKVQVAKGNGAAVVPNSFNLAPTSVDTSNAAFDLYTWDQPSQSNITLNMTTGPVSPGTVKALITGGTVDYAVPTIGQGTLNLNAVSVLSDTILQIAPPVVNIQAGVPANYTLTVKNPSNAAVTYTFTINGIPSAWLTPIAAANVAAGGQTTIPITITPDIAASPAAYQFQIVATGNTGFSGSVYAQMNVGQTGNPGPNTSQVTTGAQVTFVPPTVTLGQGQSLQTTLVVNNTGNLPDNFYFGYTGAPNGLYFNLPQATSVTPGNANQKNIPIVVNVQTGVTPGTYQIPFQIGSYNGLPNTTSAGTLTVTVLGSGLSAFFSPSSGNLTTTYPLFITNRGNAQDTFDIKPGGSLTQIINLSQNSVTLAPGAQQAVNVTLSKPNFLLPGNSTLAAVVTSRANSGVSTTATAAVAVPAGKGVTAAFAPAITTLQAPGSVVVTFNANNTGNIDDTYSLAISGTTGGLSASLSGSQTIASTIITGLAQAQFPVNVNLPATGSGTVTVKITSLTDNTVFASATATVQTPAAVLPPNAVAGGAQTVVAGTTVTLDGSGSNDPNTPPLPLTYAWTVLTVPAGSAVTSASIINPTAAKPTVTVDVAGTYTFKLTVSNGSQTASANATVTVNPNVIILTPVAIAGNSRSLPIGVRFGLDGSGSYDPSTPPATLTYQWTLAGKPSSSLLGNASIRNANTAKPTFLPDVVGAYTFQLAASAHGLTGTAQVVVTVTAAPPVADAGPHANVPVNSWAMLDGKKSFDWSGAKLTYAWSIVSQPPGSNLGPLDLKSNSAPKAFFRPTVAGTYTLQLVVSNGTASSTPAQVIVQASPNPKPTAVASAPPNVPVQTAVTLDGSRSYQAWSPNPALTYAWTIASQPQNSAAASIQNPATAQPQFVADVPGNYTLQLTVTGANGSDTDSVVVSAWDGNAFPIARPGADQYIRLGSAANLDSSSSADPDAGPAPLSTLWQFAAQPSSSTLTGLTNPATSKPSFTPDTNGYFVPRLRLFDGADLSYGNVTVTAANLCDADANGIVELLDIQLLTQFIGYPASGPGDPRDFDGDGQITDKDQVGCRARIQRPQSPLLTAAPSSLYFVYTRGGAVPPAQGIRITTPSPSTFNLIPYSFNNWLKVNSTTGSTTDQAYNATITVDPSGLTPGVYGGYIDVLIRQPGSDIEAVVLVVIQVN